jgi:ribosomal-protein-alanine N-acetyltransferase
MDIYLRAFEIEDYKKINQWRKDAEMNKLTTSPKRFVSSEVEKRWVEEKIFSQNERYLAICLLSNDTIIGYMSLIDIDMLNRTAFWSGYRIGDKENREKGYGSQAAMLLLEYAFEELGMNRVYGESLEDNKVSLKICESLGFKREGVLRNHVFKNNAFHNIVPLGKLKEEYEQVKASYFKK